MLHGMLDQASCHANSVSEKIWLQFLSLQEKILGDINGLARCIVAYLHCLLN